MTCERCGTEPYALPDGSPRPHLRPTRPGETLYTEVVPPMIECNGELADEGAQAASGLNEPSFRE